MAKKEEGFLEIKIEPMGFSTMFTDRDREDPFASKIVKSFENGKYSTLYNLAFQEPGEWFSPSLGYLHKVASKMVSVLVKTRDIEALRENVELECDETVISDLAAQVPFIRNSEYVNSDWVWRIWSHLLLEYKFEIMGFEGGTQEYFNSKNDDLHIPGRIFFHLVEDRKTEGFAFVASYSSISNGKIHHHPLAHALKEFKGKQEKLIELLTYLEKVADKSDFISTLMVNGELFHPLAFSPDEAYTFLTEVPVYEECGIICRIPKWWNRNKKQISMEMVIETGKPSLFNAESLLSLRPVARMDGEELTPEEINAIIEAGRGLVRIKGKWVAADGNTLRKSLEMMKDLEGTSLTAMEALNMTSGIKDADDMPVKVVAGDFLKNMFARMREADFKDVELPESFKGRLRPYQQRGYNWMCQLRDLGFGACLADDMGLGKTIQVIAHLEHVRDVEGGHHLLVVPASLMGNWSREIGKFAPEMPFNILHGAKSELKDTFLTITTYGMVRTRKELSKMEWDSVILDESQAIKNPSTAQSKSIRELKGRFRLAMTGTPVENGLADMWSLFDFTNRGLLGTFSDFKDFGKRIVGDPDGYRRLREITSPFILRRLKTDKRIIDDLPEKSEIDILATLSKKQKILYEDYMEQFKTALEMVEPQSRRGLVLGAITKFKQICNHPDQFMGMDTFAETDSGKFEQLRVICENIRDSGERVLVFTQYREMTRPLEEFLEGVFGIRGFVLHGQTSLKDRNDMVRRFNDCDEYIPFMVLSLKAGGVGLNLTAANHVVHFDRWWNPAVENQATDRAFRIGQTRNVMVYRLICHGTIEERIAESIENKKELADMVVGTGENWITEMSDEELIDMFRLVV